MSGSNSFLDGALRVLRDVTVRALRRATKPASKRAAPGPDRRQAEPAKFRQTTPRPSAPDARPASPTRQTSSPAPRPGADGGYPGDFTGTPTIRYSPRNDREPDPGEVVWTWVPYEEDHSKGKDRPVLLIGRDGDWLLGLQVTSQDHDRDAAQEARAGRLWMDIGTGAWDRERRPSEARVNRIIRIAAADVRRVGAMLDEDIFAQVAAAVLRHY